MQIIVADAVWQTIFFTVIFGVILVASVKKDQSGKFFSKNVTNELKGLAMLAIIFSHIGYFLVADHRFLFPLSVLAGVGVNLFLFLSGFGLSNSYARAGTTIMGFYWRRLKKLFVPLWMVLSLILVMDWLFLGRTYPTAEIIQSYLGFYPAADIWRNIDSPLWYFSMILFYYLIFPLIFWRKVRFLAPVLILIVTAVVLQLPLPVTEDVFNLYRVHFVSFPLGVMFALATERVSRAVSNRYVRLVLIPVFLMIAAYTSINSGVGLDKNIEQTISLITMFSIIFVFMLKDIDFRLFYLFGKYSFVIYLLHWPILSRYGVLYSTLPASVATAVYLCLFLLVAYLFEGNKFWKKT